MSETNTFIIDNNLRRINIPDGANIFGVAGDIEVKYVSFEMPRYYNGIDMSEFSIFVDYENAKGDRNYYKVVDIKTHSATNPQSSDNITFTWLLESDVTAYQGTVVFAIRMVKRDGTKIIKQFDTDTATGIVLDGMNVFQRVPLSDQKDILGKIENDVVENIQENLNNHTVEKKTELNAYTDEKKNTINEFTDEKKKEISDLTEISKTEIEKTKADAVNDLSWKEPVDKNTAAISSLKEDIEKIHSESNGIFLNLKRKEPPIIDDSEIMNITSREYNGNTNIKYGKLYRAVIGASDVPSGSTDVNYFTINNSIASLLYPHKYEPIAGTMYISGESCNRDCYLKPSDVSRTSLTDRYGHFEVKFGFDGDKIDLLVHGYATIRIKIDDGNGWIYKAYKFQKVGLSGRARYQYICIDFGTAKNRKICIEMADDDKFAGLYFSQIYNVYPLENKTVIYWDGSSITSSIAIVEQRENGFPYIATEMLNADCINVGVGSTGFTTKGAGYLTIGERIAKDVYECNPKILILGGAINDLSTDNETFETEISRLFGEIAETIPNCMTIVLGIFAPRPDGSGRYDLFNAKDEILRKYSAIHSFPFISSLNGKIYSASGDCIKEETRWITGSGYVANEAHDGNSDIYIGDGTHLNIEGHKYIANRMVSSILTLVS